MKKRILIVGGTGFIGFHLAKKCLKKKFLVTSLSFGKPKKERYLKKVKYVQCDISNKNNLKKLSYKFDLVFLDPPFDYKKINILFDNLEYSKIIHSKTLIILHRHIKSFDEFKKNFKIVREEKYGNSKIIFGYFIF